MEEYIYQIMEENYNRFTGVNESQTVSATDISRSIEAFINWLFRGPFMIGENGSGKIIGFRPSTGESKNIRELFEYWTINKN